MSIPVLPTEDAYFEWLYDLVDGEWNDSNHSHICLLRELHSTPFVWSVPNDDNRAEDGIGLRYVFRESYSLEDDAWLNLDCSFLEMMIALSQRMAFESLLTTQQAFWLMMRNLQLSRIVDIFYTDSEQRYVASILETVNLRTYTYSGEGGLFPLNHARGNQQHVELLYQMSAYLLENNRDLYNY